jgi:beta-glucosidase
MYAMQYSFLTGFSSPFTDSNEDAPWALGKLLEHLKLKYGNPPVMVHENGRPEKNLLLLDLVD